MCLEKGNAAYRIYNDSLAREGSDLQWEAPFVPELALEGGMGPEGYLPGRPHPRQGTQHKLAGHLKQPAGRQTLCRAPQTLADDLDAQSNTRHRCRHNVLLGAEHKTGSARPPRLSQASVSHTESSGASGLPAQGCKCNMP
jgi:hypothetical protein